jgi:hypothetical protein
VKKKKKIQTGVRKSVRAATIHGGSFILKCRTCQNPTKEFKLVERHALICFTCHQKFYVAPFADADFIARKYSSIFNMQQAIQGVQTK